jgi:hypothetical protein
MKKLLLIVLLCAATCFAQSNFDGTWKWNVDKTQFAQKPDVFSLQSGMYKCLTCVPEVNVKADGKDQPVAGHPGFNSIAIKQVDDRTIQTVLKMDGKVVGETTRRVEPNGNTLNVKFTDHPVNGEPVKGSYMMARVKKGDAGAHLISGSWRMDKFAEISENGMMMTLKMEGDQLRMTAPTGESYAAKFDGQDYPYKGNYGITHVALRRVNANTIEETDKKDGKVLSVSRISLSPDGKKLMVVSDDKVHGTTSKYQLDRQPAASAK